MLDYDGFSNRVATLVEIDLDVPVNPYDGLYTDLGFDSLQAFQLIIIIETLADAMPIDEVPELYTMQDAYDYYAQLCAGRETWPA